jgi:hypothetical protein
MGDSVLVHGSKCRCGWYLPVGIHLEAEGTALETKQLNPTIHFRCPSCSKGYRVTLTQRAEPLSPSTSPSLITLGSGKD